MQEKFQKISEDGWEYLYLDRGDDTTLIFILHGYGANATDLAGLAQYLDPEGKWSWVFPEAPIQLGFMANARAWFPIDEQALQKAMMTGIARNFQEQAVADLDKKIDNLKSFINSFGESREILIGGFSQGGMMSLHIHHHFQSRLKGLLLMSSALVDETKFQAINSPKFKTFMTHGKSDPVVSFQEGQFTKKRLNSFDYDVELFDFDGAHEISLSALDKIKHYLNQSCS